MSEAGDSLQSEYISASAGCGKTFALTQRFASLIVHQVPPSSICALTFTRAATREIFSALIQRLLRVNDKHECISTPEERAALRQLIADLPRLQIMTIDAFLAHIARLFSFELGINPDFMLYDGFDSIEGKQAITEILRRLLLSIRKSDVEQYLRVLDVQQEDVADARGLSVRLMDLFKALHDLHLEYKVGWGDLKAIGCDDEYAIDFEQAIKCLAGVKERLGTERALTAFQSLLDGFSQVAQGKEFPSEVVKKSFFQRLIEEHLFKQYSLEVSLSESETEALTRLWKVTLRRSLSRAARYTQSLEAALGYLEQTYQTWQSETGMLTFNELTQQLGSRIKSLIQQDSHLITDMAFRLDAKMKHLMIDEFQDTSRIQWQALSEIATELASSTSANEGTFYYVGDTKQSIYGWRGGDATLFGSETLLGSGHGPVLNPGAPLVKSYRSASSVLAFVNELFTFDIGEVQCQREGCEVPYRKIVSCAPFQVDVLTDWAKSWSPHVAANTTRKGFAGLYYFTPKTKTKDAIEEETSDIELLADAIAARYQVLRDSKQTIAVLASTNKVFNDPEKGLLKALEKREIPCAFEGSRRVLDTTIGKLFYALFLWMQDPRATLEQSILQAVALLPQESVAEELTAWLRRFNTEGAVAFVDFIYKKVQPSFECSSFDQEALLRMREDLEQISAQRMPSLAQVVALLEDETIPTITDPSVVSLMSIHRSKGLTYDVVFTYFDKKEFVNQRYLTYLSSKDPTTWVLKKPALLDYQMRQNTTLDEAVKAYQTHLFRDAICSIYVGVTRARSEQHVFITGALDSKSTAKNGELDTFARFIYAPFTECEKTPMKRLCVVKKWGTLDWMESSQKDEKAPLIKTQTVGGIWQCQVESDEAKVNVILPSESSKTAAVSEMLRPIALAGKSQGISLHAQLAAIEWTDTPPFGLFKEVFKKPTEPCEVWRERTFAVSLAGKGEEYTYIPGQFDRVHLFTARKTAIIYDFKTGTDQGVTPAYKNQLENYQLALSILTGYEKENIELHLLFTQTGRDVKV